MRHHYTHTHTHTHTRKCTTQRIRSLRTMMALPLFQRAPANVSTHTHLTTVVVINVDLIPIVISPLGTCEEEFEEHHTTLKPLKGKFRTPTNTSLVSTRRATPTRGRDCYLFSLKCLTMGGGVQTKNGHSSPFPSSIQQLLARHRRERWSSDLPVPAVGHLWVRCASCASELLPPNAPCWDSCRYDGPILYAQRSHDQKWSFCVEEPVANKN